VPATVTLSTTTLTLNVSAQATLFQVASTSGLTPGKRLFVDGELVRVVGLGVNASTEVNVQRGQDSTRAVVHDAGETVYIGEAHQFYSKDPSGVPPGAVLVSPYINVSNGTVWFAQGGPEGDAKRWWQKQTATYGTGPLGVRTVSYDLTSST